MGALARLTRLHVWIIAAVLTAIVLGCEFYFLVKPQQDAFQAAKDRYDAAYPGGTGEKKQEAQKALQEAVKKVGDAKAKWRVYDARLMPDVDLSTGPISASKQLWNEQLFVLGGLLNRYLQADHNVQILQSSIQIAAPSTDPNAVNKKVFDYPLGNVAVMGTFENVLRNEERWNGCNRLVLTDGLTLSGTSPQLTGTYSIECFEFSRGEATKDVVPQAGGSGAGGFGGPGAMRGMMPPMGG